MWDNGGLNAPLSHVLTAVYPVDAHYQAVPYQTAGILLKDPWLVLGESYPDVSIMKQFKNSLDIFPPIFVHFLILKFSKKTKVH